MAENIQAEILRDTDLEQRLLEAVIADRNEHPRSKQLQVGPSEVGGCRELLRAGLFEAPEEAEPETNWAVAAHVGTVMGADLERIFGERLDALTQQRVTATFGMLGGLQISGATDLIFLGDDQISDLKGNADIGSLLQELKRDASAIETLLAIRREGLLFNKAIETPDGGYELTAVIIDKIAKLHYYVQIAIYVMGAMQLEMLSANAEGRIVYYDRSGGYQGFIAVRVTAEMIALFYEIGQMRIAQVLQAQQAYEQTGGNPAVIAPLRDKSPSYCFSPKVMCPRRQHCWLGSEWTSQNQIVDPEQIALKERYQLGRDLAKLADGMKRSAKDELKQHDVTGMFPDGSMLTWTKAGAINLVETTVTEPQPQAVLDRFMPPVDLQQEIDTDRAHAAAQAIADAQPKLTRDERWKALESSKVPGVVHQAKVAGVDHRGRKGDIIARILEKEYPGEKAPEPREKPVVETVSGVDREDMEAGERGALDGETLPEHLAHRDDIDQEEKDRLLAEREKAMRPERDPRIDRVHFEPSEPDEEPEGEPPMTQEELDREEARRRLARGPHVAPLLDKPEPTPVVAPTTLPDGSPYVPLQDEDPARPGLFLFHIANKDRLRQQQYDHDEQFRNNAIRQRARFTGEG